MQSNLKIKICGMMEPSNIREVSTLKPGYMGFIFYPGSKRYIGHPDQDLLTNIGEYIQPVAVFVNEEPDKILRLTSLYGFSHVQLHGHEPERDCIYLKERGLTIIKAFRIKTLEDLDRVTEYHYVCDFFLFDTETGGWGGSGRKFNWNLLKGFRSPLPVFLSGGIRKDDALLLKNVWFENIYAVDINSGFESNPGIKNVEDIRYFMTQLNC
jgi:phosphoribosylanthranilate isomerase